jgi:hypothetical protein
MRWRGSSDGIAQIMGVVVRLPLAAYAASCKQGIAHAVFLV